MATNKNITMKQFNGTDYDTLYPKTKVEQVEGAYAKQQILSNSTKGLYGLGNNAVPDDAFQKLGGLRAVIHVFTQAGASVSMTKGGKTFTATADSEGVARLYPTEFGKWTVTASRKSKTINIDANAVFYLVMSDLESLSWSKVGVISKAGAAKTQFNIGDEKTLTVNGESYTAVIIGFDHDTPVDTTAYGRTKAGITWQLKNCLNTPYVMNSSDTNEGGWASCKMRTSTMTALLSQLTSDLKNAIVKVKKPSSVGKQSSNINITEDSLFLLSEVEVFGSATYSVPGEGSQYEYYQSGNSRVKISNIPVDYWWERSPYRDGGTSFCIVNSQGNALDISASTERGVSFGFCV